MAKGTQVILPIFDMPQRGKLSRHWKEIEIPAMMCRFISPMIRQGALKALNGQISGTLDVVFELGNIPSECYRPASTFYSAYTEKGASSTHLPSPMERSRIPFTHFPL